MNKKIIVASIAGLVAIIAALFGLIYLSWFWLYWIFIVTIIAGTVLLATRNNTVKNYLIILVGQLASNKHWRLVAVFIISIVLTFSALLVGFGRPVFAISAEETKTFIYDNMAESNNIAATSGKLSLAVGNIGKAFGFTNNTSATTHTTKTDIAQKKMGKRHSSWWHWKLAIFSWACCGIYFLIVTGKELVVAFKKAWKSHKRKRRIHSIVNQPAISSPVIPASTTETGSSGLGGWFAKIFPKGGFYWHLFIEFLGDYLPVALNRIIKKL